MIGDDLEGRPEDALVPESAPPLTTVTDVDDALLTEAQLLLGVLTEHDVVNLALAGLITERRRAEAVDRVERAGEVHRFVDAVRVQREDIARGNVDLALLVAKGVARRDRYELGRRWISQVGLNIETDADKYPHELSGGMRQRVALARALAATGDEESGGGLLLMDEPFAALDAITRDFLQGELRRIWATTGTAVLFVTHDVEEAVRLGQRVVLLSSRPGTVVREWDLVGVDDKEALTEEITGRLRDVISTHARA